jgi:hypothetical protein
MMQLHATSETAMTIALAVTSIDAHLRLGKFDLYCHGPSIPIAWPLVSTPGERVFRLGRMTVYLTRQA